ncbi:MAG TPA: hypothetical protein VF575_03930 [Candidatus Saccharimonadales bacterium]|jgi:hypothetical protein
MKKLGFCGIIFWYSYYMLYLIGGPPRMGKSTMAQRLLKDATLPYVSTDGLTVMLEPAGLSSFYDVRKSELFFPYLDLFVSRIIKSCPDYLIEGDAFGPDHVEILKTKYDLKCVFLTMNHTSTEKIVQNVGFDRWTDEVSNEHLEGLVKRIQLASKDIQLKCELYNIKCIDLSENYTEGFDEAYQFLRSN